MRFLLLFTLILVSGCMEAHRSGEPRCRRPLRRKPCRPGLNVFSGFMDGVSSNSSGLTSPDPISSRGDLEFWIDGPDRLAIRISKLGDTYLWLGMNSREAWVFDLTQQPTRLLRDQIDRLQEPGLENGPWLTILEMVQLMKIGLGAVSPPPVEDLVSSEMRGDSIAQYDWRVDSPSGNGTRRQLRLSVNTLDWRPLDVEIRDTDEKRGLRLDTPSSKTKRIRVPGLSSLGWPVISRVMDVRPLETPETSAKFAFEEIVASLEGQPIERIFDLKILRDAIGPEIEGSILELSGEESASISR